MIRRQEFAFLSEHISVSDKLTKFEIDIQRYLNHGWRLHGAPVTSAHGGTGHFQITQALVRETFG